MGTPCLVSKFKSSAMAMKAAKKATEGDAAPKKAMKAMKAMKATKKAMKAKKREGTPIEATSAMAFSQNFGESAHIRVDPIDLIDLTACIYFSRYVAHVALV